MVDIIYLPQPDNDVAYKKQGYKMRPIGITIHNTAQIATARDVINYMHITDDYRSFHYAVDQNEIVQGEDLNYNCWHASDGETGIGNRQTIAIEICDSCYLDNKNAEYEEIWNKQYKKQFEKAQENAAWLTAYLLMEYGWGFNPSRIYKHEDWSDKHCPHRTLDNYGWGYFLTLVEKAYSQLEKEQPMTADERKEFEALKKKVNDLTVREGNDVSTLSTQINLTKNGLGVISDQLMLPFYPTFDDIPDDDWCKPTIKKLVDNGIIKGDENGKINIPYILARVLVILDRENLFN